MPAIYTQHKVMFNVEHFVILYRYVRILYKLYCMTPQILAFTTE